MISFWWLILAVIISLVIGFILGGTIIADDLATKFVDSCGHDWKVLINESHGQTRWKTVKQCEKCLVTRIKIYES